MKPSPIDELGACFVGEEDVVGEKKACMELFLCELVMLVLVSWVSRPPCVCVCECVHKEVIGQAVKRSLVVSVS